MNKKALEKEEFNKTAGHPLQTWEWGEFRANAGNEVVRFDFGQITVHKIPKTKYKVGAFIKGPKPTQKMLNELKKYAKENNLIFIKMEPNIPVSIDSQPITHNSKTDLTKLLRGNGGR